MRFAISNCVLHRRDKGTRRGRSEHAHPSRISTRVLDHLGLTLLTIMLPVLTELSKSIDRVAAEKRERREKYEAVIAETPFDHDDYSRLAARAEAAAQAVAAGKTRAAEQRRNNNNNNNNSTSTN